jgi:hypothetical protein
MAIIKKYQQGGPMPAEATPAPEMGGQDQMMAQLEQMAMEIIQSMGPEGAAMLAEMIMQMLQSAQQPVGAPAEGQPVFRKGGKLARRVK